MEGIPGVDYAVEQMLHCPTCKTPHIDAGKWRTLLHFTHQCQNDNCGQEWEPRHDKMYVVGVTLEELNDAATRLADDLTAAKTRQLTLLVQNNLEVDLRQEAQADAKAWRELQNVARRIIFDTPLKKD